MIASRNLLVSIAILTTIVAVAVLAARQPPLAAGLAASPTPFHEQFPPVGNTPGAMTPTVYPLPVAEDMETANTMTASGAAMIAAAEGMARAAETMTASNVAELDDLGQHWAQDAAALRERGAWMVLAATAESMVHDPDRAHELNLQSLRGNGLSMAAEGQAMIDHGAAMIADVDRLRQGGQLSETEANGLKAEAAALVEAGEALRQDGERMRDYADSLLQSLGQ